MSEEHPVLPVRIWWWMEDNVPGLLKSEQVFFHCCWSVRHPVTRYRDWREKP